MKTAFSRDRYEFTKRAHLAAQQQFYPRMFPHGVDFEDVTQTAHDLEYAIDCQRMQWMLCRGEIEYSRHSRIDQHFIGLPFKRLKDLGASLFTHDGRICQLCGGTAADAAIEYRGRIDGWVHYGCAEERAA